HGLRRSEWAARAWWCPLAALAMLVGWPASAQQQGPACQPEQFVDRTAPGAGRELTWDWNIANDPEHCMQGATGQTVVWIPNANANPPINFDDHPLRPT